MEANQLFIFKQASLSSGTHGCNNLFIPSTGERPLVGGWGGRRENRARTHITEWEMSPCN